MLKLKKPVALVYKMSQGQVVHSPIKLSAKRWNNPLFPNSHLSGLHWPPNMKLAKNVLPGQKRKK